MDSDRVGIGVYEWQAQVLSNAGSVDDLDVIDEEGIDTDKEFRGADDERQDGAEADFKIVLLLELDEARCCDVGVGGAGGEENVDGERGRHDWMVVGGEY